MLLHEVAKITPSTTPIRIYIDGNPFDPLISLVYSDTLLRSDYILSYKNSEVVRFGAQVHNDIPYLVVVVEAD